ncbi:hypothetical protein GWI33_007658 [Rhynchophorus ferrugineus]|uniref:Uncharacterized protein n=1 Tax=Rhynchophorus ferrugineus TaxID=354439 RepID=A0A834ID32_RHYFE|nr:hypothetical protein GWI33_007658 [Rhynchophorus ferrugineus]
MTRLIYVRKYRKTITTVLLKSVCYIYPIAYMQFSSLKTKMLGDDILNVILPDYLLYVERVLSATSSQLLWVLSKANTRVKKAATVFWLTNINNDQRNLLKHCIETTNSEHILVEILLDNKNKDIIQKCLQLIELIQSPSLSKNLHSLLPKFLYHSETFPFIVRAISSHIPQDQNIALLILTTSVESLVTSDDQETLTKVCQLSKKLLNMFSREKEKVQFFCNDVTLLRVLIYRAGVTDDDLVKEILMLLSKMIRLQREVNRNPSNVTAMKLSLLLKKPKGVSSRTLDLLWDILRLNTLITLEKTDILLIQHCLFDLADHKRLANKCNLCLMKLIKFYPALLYSPTLSTFIEDLCFYSSKNKYSTGSVKLILAWIHLAAMDGKGIMFFLPKRNVLQSFFTNFKQFKDDLVQRNLYLISKLYSHNKSLMI